jgi:hypothetical protein
MSKYSCLPQEVTELLSHLSRGLSGQAHTGSSAPLMGVKAGELLAIALLIVCGHDLGIRPIARSMVSLGLNVVV